MGEPSAPQGDHVLNLGDCIEGMKALADKSVGCTICDPPYSEHVHKNIGAEHRNDGIRPRDAISFTHATRESAMVWASEICRITQRWAMFFCDERAIHFWGDALETAGWLWVRTGYWRKTDAMPQLSGDRPSAATECIVIGHRQKDGRLRWNGGGKRAEWSCGVERDGRPDHPSPKPLALMEALVSDFTDPGELICDPFAGSGTTGVACKRLGRRFIGWEKDPKFHAAAVKRIEAARQQGELFARGPKPKQARLLP